MPSTNTLYAASWDGHTVYAINVSNNAIIATITIPLQYQPPQPIIGVNVVPYLSQYNGNLYVDEPTANVIIDSSTNSIITSQTQLQEIGASLGGFAIDGQTGDVITGTGPSANMLSITSSDETYTINTITLGPPGLAATVPLSCFAEEGGLVFCLLMEV